MNPLNTWKGKLEAASFLPSKDLYRQCECAHSTALCLLLPLRQWGSPNSCSQYILLLCMCTCATKKIMFHTKHWKKADFGRRMYKVKMRSVYLAISLILQFNNCESAGYPSKLNIPKFWTISTNISKFRFSEFRALFLLKIGRIFQNNLWRISD